jgi:coxsackievirus/adenovirus receptor
MPVCGKDGLTYANRWELECTGGEKDHDFPCKGDATHDVLTSNEVAVVDEATQPTVDAAPCGCHGPSRLVCGADGKFYGNQCTLECAKVERGDGCEFCPIPKVFAPTCGKDGLTYVNPWELKCTGVEKDHDGPCGDYDVTDDMLTSTECQKACAPVFEPVCGMNNKTYANKCRMECDGVELKHEGRCSIQTI